jgi:DNA-binding NtrC family response regulator
MQLFQFKNSPTAWRILTQAEPGLFITGDIMHPDPQWNGQNIVRRLLERKVEYPIILMSGWPRTLECMSKVQAEYRKFSLLPEPFTPAQFYRELGRFFSLRNLP